MRSVAATGVVAMDAVIEQPLPKAARLSCHASRPGGHGGGTRLDCDIIARQKRFEAAHRAVGSASAGRARAPAALVGGWVGGREECGGELVEELKTQSNLD